jgi:PAS domain S-box-containing protein
MGADGMPKPPSTICGGATGQSSLLEERFDRLCRLAARQLGVPMAAITLVGTAEIHLISAVGLPREPVPRADLLCGVAVDNNSPLVVRDAAGDPRFNAGNLPANLSGIRFYVSVPIRDADGHCVGTVCGLDTIPHPDGVAPGDLDLLADIAALAGELLQHEEHEAEAERLSQRHARLEGHHRAVVEAIPLPLLTIDREGDVTGWNPAAERVFGWSAAEAIGRFGPHVPPDQEAAARAVQAPTRRGERVVAYETVRMRKDGTRLPVSISTAPLHDAEGRPDGAVVVIEDISARRRAALDAAVRTTRLETQARLLTGIANAMPQAAADLPGVLRLISEAALQGIDGVEAGVWRLDAAGTSFQLQALVGMDGRPIPPTTPKHAALQVLPCGPVLVAALQAGRQIAAGNARTDPRVAELLQPYVQPFGIGALLSAPVRVGAELLGLVSACSVGEARVWTTEEQGFLASLADLAALALEAARRADTMGRLAEAVVRAEAASRTKSRFLGAMSHELRTPLNAIIGFAELLQGAEVPTARRQEFAGHIVAGGRQLLDVFNDVLEQAQLEAGQLRLAEDRVPVPRLLDEAALAAAPEAVARGIVIGLALTEMPALRGDPARLRQSLDRLLSHALRASPPDGRIRLGADYTSDAGFRIWIEHAGAEDAPRAFEPFAGPEMLTRPAGLGLPLARALVEAHGGGVAAEALPGHRQRLLVTLPASRALPGYTPLPTSTVQPAGATG